MTWTSETPTVPGWYWWLVEPSVACIISIAQDPDGEFYMEEHGPDGGINLTELTGQWAGPILAPEEEV